MTLSTQHSPRLSIGLPVYNGERYLAEILDCFLTQTFQDFELILLDDCSTDNSAELLQSYAGNPHVSHIVLNDRLEEAVERTCAILDAFIGEAE